MSATGSPQSRGMMIATLGAITVAAAALWYGGRNIREEQGKRSIFKEGNKKPLNEKKGTDAGMNSSDVSKVVVGK